MNSQFLKTFNQLRGSEEMEIFKKTRNSEVIPLEITEGLKNYIRKYLLKSEYIESILDNSIIVSTNNSSYILSFYDKFIILTEKINCKNISKIQSFKRYVRYS
jgi:hypothetical protein